MKIKQWIIVGGGRSFIEQYATEELAAKACFEESKKQVGEAIYVGKLLYCFTSNVETPKRTNFEGSE